MPFPPTGKHPAAGPSAGTCHLTMEAAATATRLEYSLASLANVATAALKSAPPLLVSAPPCNRVARIEDVETSWFSYWMRELDEPFRATAEAWRCAAALQWLYASGGLRPGSTRVVIGAAPPVALTRYLESVFPTAQSKIADFAVAFGGGEEVTNALSSAQKGALWVVDWAFEGAVGAGTAGLSALNRYVESMAAGGWIIGALEASFGNHPLDGYVAGSETSPGYPGGPTLRFQKGAALVAPLVIGALRP